MLVFLLFLAVFSGRVLTQGEDEAGGGGEVSMPESNPESDSPVGNVEGMGDSGAGTEGEQPSILAEMSAPMEESAPEFSQQSSPVVDAFPSPRIQFGASDEGSFNMGAVGEDGGDGADIGGLSVNVHGQVGLDQLGDKALFVSSEVLPEGDDSMFGMGIRVMGPEEDEMGGMRDDDEDMDIGDDREMGNGYGWLNGGDDEAETDELGDDDGMRGDDDDSKEKDNDDANLNLQSIDTDRDDDNEVGNSDDGDDDDERKMVIERNLKNDFFRLLTSRKDNRESDDDNSEESSNGFDLDSKESDGDRKLRARHWYRNEYFDDYWSGENGYHDWMDDYFDGFDGSEESKEDKDNDSSDSKESSEEDGFFVPPYRKRLNRLQRYFERLQRESNRKWRYNNMFWWRFMKQHGQKPTPGPFREKYVNDNPNIPPPPPKDSGWDPPVEKSKPPPEIPSLKNIPHHPWDWVLTTPSDLSVTGPGDIPPDFGATPPSVTPPNIEYLSTVPSNRSELRRTTLTDISISDRKTVTFCNRRVDVVVVLDGKNNDADFELLKASLAKLIQSLTVSEKRVRFGLVFNSNDATARVPLVGAKRRLLEKLQKITRPLDGRRIDKGLSVMRGMFRIRGRYGVPKVGLAILNDKSDFPNKTIKQADRSKEQDIRIFALGVGKQFSRVELDSIAYSPEFTYSVADYKGLIDYVGNLAKRLCDLSRERTRTGDGGGGGGGGGHDQGDPHVPIVPPSGRRRRQRVPNAYKGAGPCDGCRMLNGAGFNRHPTDCDKFIQCFFGVNNTVRAVYKDCPWGLFWNQTVLTCQDPIDANCPNDPCVFARGKIKQYRSKDSCRSYWECNSHSHKRCCPPGHRYEEDVGCVNDPSCTDRCSKDPEPIARIEPVVREPIGAVGCDKLPIPNNNKYYKQRISAKGWSLMPCAPGTEFNPVDCGCSIINVYRNPAKVVGCQPELILDFEDGVRDTSGRSTWINNQGVEAIDGSAHFDGRNRLLIPKYTSAEFGNTFIVRIRYRETGSFNGRSAVQALVNNGDCGDEGSIQIYTTNENVGFVVKTKEEGGFKGMEIPKGDGWKEIEYALIDGHLEGRLDEVSYSKPARGAIEPRNCALQIGYGFGYHNFVGQMDKVEIYKCKPERDFTRS